MVLEREDVSGIVDGRNPYWKTILKVVVLPEPVQTKDPQDLPLPKWSPPLRRRGEEERGLVYASDQRFCDHVKMDIQKQQRWQRDLQNQLIALGVQRLKRSSKRSKNSARMVISSALQSRREVIRPSRASRRLDNSKLSR